jgi:hypothetical protein
MTGHGAAAVGSAERRIVVAAVLLMLCAGFNSFLLHLAVCRAAALSVSSAFFVTWRQAKLAPTSLAQT